MAIEPFALNNETANLAHINTRKENHGEEIKKGYDFKLVFKLHNSYLNRISAGLQDMFYRAHETADMLDKDNKPVLRFPKLGVQSYDLEVPRALLRIHDIDDEKNDFVLGGGKMNAFKFDPQEGGTVHLTIRVQFSDPDEEEMIKAQRVQFQDVKVSLTCAEPEQEPDNFDKAMDADKAPQSEAGKALEDLFSGGAPAVGGGDAEALAFPDTGGDGALVIDAAKADADAAPVKEKKPPKAKAGDADAPRARRGSGKAVVAPE
ncbi:MAG: hypothetical protein V4641_16340 [Pseudomonadota bacterium]